MNSLQFTPSELIYLFLDGEHSGVERSVLFKAMADSQDLQHEFEDALKIRTAALTEAQSIIPPAALTQSLMGRAGFTAVGAAVGSASTGWFAGMFSQWGSIAMMMLLPVLAGSAGYVLGGRSGNDVAQRSVAAPVVDRQQSREQSSNESSVVAELRQQVRDLGARVKLLSRSSQSRSIASDPKGYNTTYSQSLQQTATDGVPPKTEMTLSTTLGSQGPETVAASSVPSLSQQLIQPTSSANVIQLQQYSLPDVQAHSASKSEISELNSTTFVPHFIVGLRGYSSLAQTLDSLADPSVKHNIGNACISIRYSSSPSVQYVVEAGRENFATRIYKQGYVPPSDSRYYIQQNMFWVAVGGRYTTQPIDALFGTRMFVQACLGSSDIGPILRPMMGVEWQPDSRVVFHAGLEQLIMRSSYKGTAEIGMKTSFSYGVSLNF